MVIKPETEITHIISEQNITKVLTTSLSKGNPNSIKNYTYDNQYGLNDSKFYKIQEI